MGVVAAGELVIMVVEIRLPQLVSAPKRELSGIERDGPIVAEDVMDGTDYDHVFWDVGAAVGGAERFYVVPLRVVVTVPEVDAATADLAPVIINLFEPLRDLRVPDNPVRLDLPGGGQR